MYIFAEPVTEAQVAQIQGQNDVKIQEFERKIMGLHRESDPATEDDDSRWEDIQANVRAAMDEDEFSVDDPNKVSDVEAKGLAEAPEPKTDGQTVMNRGPLYANQATQSDKEFAEISSLNHKPKDSAGADEGDIDIEDNESEGLSALDDPDVELSTGSTEDQDLEDSTRSGDTAESTFGEEAGDDPQQHTEDVEEALAHLSNAGSRQISEGEHGKHELDSAAEEGVDDSLDSKGPTTVARNSGDGGYVPPVPGEKVSDSEDFQVNADQPFLDTIGQETASPNAKDDETPSDLLAMTLTLRNRLNGKYVLRPERMTAEDTWTIDYSLVEVSNDRRARALYDACQKRRQKKLDSPEVPEDAEVISQYLRNLRELSARGRDWRNDMDEKDRQRPLEVLGREISEEV